MNTNKKNALISSQQNFVNVIMILFFDTVSHLPEFCLIEDNKILFSKKILDDHDDKMSDCIVPIYIELEKKFKLGKKLKYLITVTGPGSYTALRVGIAFLSGLSISMKIPLIGIPCVDLFQYVINTNKKKSTAIYICSSNNQKFMCLYSPNTNECIINKVEKDEIPYIFDTSVVNTLLTNDVSILVDPLLPKNIECKKFDFKKIVLQHVKAILLLPRQEIIEPIYISNNKILS